MFKHAINDVVTHEPTGTVGRIVALYADRFGKQVNLEYVSKMGSVSRDYFPEDEVTRGELLREGQSSNTELPDVKAATKKAAPAETPANATAATPQATPAANSPTAASGQEVKAGAAPAEELKLATVAKNATLLIARGEKGKKFFQDLLTKYGAPKVQNLEQKHWVAFNAEVLTELKAS